MLGYGLKFCICDCPPPPDLRESFDRFRRDVRTKFTFLAGGNNGNDFNAKLYVKSKTWDPDPATPHLEYCMQLFESRVTNAIQNYRPQFKPNLLPNQLCTLQSLRDNKQLIVLQTDKNLGPAIMERAAYLKQCLVEHLLTPTYQQLTPAQARYQMDHTKETIAELYSDYWEELAPFERKYFQNSFKKSKFCARQFYGTPKVHKNKPVKLMRPVVSSMNSAPQILSTHLDYLFKQVVQL